MRRPVENRPMPGAYMSVGLKNSGIFPSLNVLFYG